MFVALADVRGIQPERGNWLVTYHSNDAGTSWDEKPTVIGRGHDHPAIAVDLASTQRQGWVYITTHYGWRDCNGHLHRACSWRGPETAAARSTGQPK